MRRVVVAATLACLSMFTAVTASHGATNDPYRSRQWALDRIQAESAWATADGTGALIAVVDTGVDLGHPDLATKIVAYPDADLVEPNGTCTGSRRNRMCVQDGAQDANGHGTHVAGIAAAVTNNGIGVAGTAPGARILPVRVLDANGEGTADQVGAGIRYAADKGADVINLSLGFLSGLDQVAKILGELDPVYAAVDYAWDKGAVIAIAAGNDSFPLCAEPSAHPRAVCVGATDQNDLRSFYSNSDATLTSTYLVAPGGAALLFCSGDVYSTYLRSAATTCGPESGYEALAGTSMATPFVSGAAALLASHGLSNQQIVDRLRTTSDDLGLPGRDPLYGYGRLNAARAVSG
jgi:subtilisin family serine protease